jgi:hypothetical protein
MKNAEAEVSRQWLKDSLEMWNFKFQQIDWKVDEMIFEPPASETEVAELEKRIQLELPKSFKKALLTISRHVEFRWFAPDGVKFPAPFQSNFCGDLHWGLDLLEQYEEARKGWVDNCFPNPDDSYDVVWHDKLPFYEVGNGDFWAFDLKSDSSEKIIYLSHDDGEGHGYVLADNFFDLLERWIPLACTGGEDWQWLPFVSDKNSGINPHSGNALRWKNLLDDFSSLIT